MLDDGPLVSVVIPNHDYGHYVTEALESVLAQTYSPIEVIVVDNGSSDDSLERLGPYAGRCRVVAQSDLGQSGSRNRGILEATGEWVAFLDADDVWLPTKVAEQVALATKGGAEIGLVYCSVLEVDAELRPGRVLPARHRGRLLDDLVAHPGDAIVQGGESTAMVRRLVLADVGIFDPALSIAAGWDLWRRIATSYAIDFVEEPLVLYRQHGDNLHGRLPTYERDVRYATDRMFADRRTGDLRRRRRAFGAGLDLMLAKAWFRAGNRRRAAFLALRAMLRRPALLRDIRRSH